jgi:serine/threonine protein kinase
MLVRRKEGVCGFVMEYQPLGSLRSALPARQMTKTLQLQDQFKWALQIVSLLIHLNSSAKIFYPDLRPENLLLNNGNNIVLLVPTPKITTLSDWPLRRDLRKPHRFYACNLKFHPAKSHL